MSRLARALAVGAALLAVLLGLTPAAQADNNPFDCKTPPAPQMPGRGLTALYDPAPQPSPPAADPWAPGATASLYEQYGYAGLHFFTYDLGCGGAVRDPEAVMDTGLANKVLGMADVFVAAGNGMHRRLSHPHVLFDPVDAVTTQMANRIHDGLYRPILPISLLIAGIALIWGARRQEWPHAVTAAGWALLVLTATTAVVRYPLTAAHAADDVLTSTVAQMGAHIAGQDPGSAAQVATHQNAILVDKGLYSAWLRGTFGDDTSVTARRFGPELFKTTALSWAEADQASRNPQQALQIIDAKQQAFKQVADQIKQADPDAYQHLTGHADGRTGASMLALVGAMFTALFRFVADLLVLCALFIIRFEVVLFPALAVLGLHQQLDGLVRGAAKTGLAALINAGVFALVAAVHAEFITAALDKMPTVVGLLFCVAITITLWLWSKPFRNLTAMASADHYAPRFAPLSPFKGVARSALYYTLFRRASRTGTRQGIEDAQALPEPPAPEPMPYRVVTERWSRPPEAPPPALSPGPPDLPPRLPPGPSGPSLGPGPGSGRALPPPPPPGTGPIIPAPDPGPPPLVGAGSVRPSPAVPGGVFVPGTSALATPPRLADSEIINGREVHVIFRPPEVPRA